MPLLPALFVERLKKIIPLNFVESVMQSFSSPFLSGLRINTFKVSPTDAMAYLSDLKITYYLNPCVAGSLIIAASAREQLRNDPWVNDGRLYWQSPSSALPAVVLNPHSEDLVLDVCAAPGSKTTQMALMMKNRGEITALDSVKNRFYKLKAVCTLMGALNVKCLLTDARRFRAGDTLFDKIMVDAPCSSEGRFTTLDKDSFGYWSPRKIKEMAHKQKGIILSAARCLKPGGFLVYSTCTFAPEENETVVDWFLRKTKGEFTLEPFDLPGVPRYPALKSYENRTYTQDLSFCWRVLPDGIFSGFFIARFFKH